MDRSTRLANSLRRAVLRTAAADFRLRDLWAKPDLLGRPLGIAHLAQDHLGTYDRFFGA
jgi:hypothetical protein